MIVRVSGEELDQLDIGLGNRVLDLRAWVSTGPQAFVNLAALREAAERKRAAERALAALRLARGSPRVVCLCGSTRFSEAFREANLRLTLDGHIVLTIGCDTKSDDTLLLGPEDKERLDELHKRKIDMSDEVLVLNVGGYVGESTQSEIEYARSTGVEVRYLEDPVKAAWAAKEEV